MEKYLKPEILILIPLTQGLGILLKRQLTSSRKNLFKKVIKSTANLPPTLLLIDIVMASIFGFIYSKQTGWRFYIETIAVFGFCYGSVCSFIAQKLYDKVREI